MYTYKELHAATNGFHDDNKLGEGGFGSVYWGKTTDGLQVKLTKNDSLKKEDELIWWEIFLIMFVLHM